MLINEERLLTKEEEMICDIVYGTIGELEDAVGEIEMAGETVTMQRSTALKALQLLKAYSALYSLEYKDYNREY